MESEKEIIIEEMQHPGRIKDWIEVSQCSMKNSKEAQALRKSGNDLYSKLNANSTLLEMEMVYKLYSQSIAQAEPNTEHLALAFGNRSALLSYMKKYEESVSDIDRALQINQSNSYKVKLLCRKLTCLLLQGSSKSKRVQVEIENLMLKLDQEDKSEKSLIDLFAKAKQKRIAQKSHNKGNKPSAESSKVVSKKLQENLFDSVSVKQDKKYGRYLVANKDFNAGEIIIAESPYVEIIELKNSHLFCSHCFAMSWSTVPCDYCTWSMFCSDKCKSEAWNEYHNIECVVVSKMLTTEAGKILLETFDERLHLKHYFMFSIKSLLIGLKQAGSIASLKKETKVADKFKGDCSKIFQRDNFQGSKFQHMYMLNDDVLKDRLRPYAMSSILILFNLMKFTSFFEDDFKSMCYKDVRKYKKVIFIGTLLLKLHKISDKNTQNSPGEIVYHQCLYSRDVVACNTKGCCLRGSFIAPINSLINYSCNPNVKNLVTEHQKVIVYSLLPIKKDSQIFSAYTGTFYNMEKNMRQMALRGGSNFVCDCLACEENWPTIKDIMANPIEHIAKNPKDRQFIYIEDALVRSIINPDYDKATYDQKTIKTLSKAMTKVIENVNQPSISIWKLQNAIQGAFEKVYERC